MQSPAPGGSGSASAIALSPIERPAFAHLFNLADPERTGIVTGDAAVAFFAKSKLPPAVLGQIWAIADSANNGFLTPPSFSTALRLIGHAQRGETVTEALTKRPGPPPTMDGITLPLSAQLTGSASQTPTATPAMPGVIEIKPEDRARYTRIFANSGPQGGLIDGEKAKEIFVKSKLPFDKLGAIWNLADTQARGALDLTDFIIGMHFIQNTMNGTLNSIPAALPPGLYEQAKGGAARLGAGFSGGPLSAQVTGGSATGALPRQFTGQPISASGSRTFSPAPATGPGSGMATFQSPQVTGAGAGAGNWDVTPEEKLRSDRFFDGLDVEKKGELEGGAVVPFFMQSKLNEATLAHIWDLSDITQSGTLSKDEFAVAMHLINQQLAGKELPQELSQSLIPPSMRSMSLPQAVNPQQTDTQKDLFSLMDDDPPPPAVSATSAFIAPTSTAPTVSNIAAGSAAAPAAAKFASGPFDDDFFGGGPSAAPAQSAPLAAALSPTATGGSFGGAAGVRSPSLQAPGTPSRSGNAAAGFGADQSAEYGNKSIQLQSTQKAVADLQSKRSDLESAVTTNAGNLAELETRLSTVRGQHETESKLVKDLEARRNAQSEELRKLREDVIREESALSALKAEKDELEQAVMHDREDVRDMKKKMGEIQIETKSLKETLEKLRKDARQQKGLVAISKKQLGAAESDRDKAQGEIAAVERGESLGDIAASPAPAAARDLASPRSVASPSLPAEAALSPAASVRSTNPFDRFGAPSGATPRSESPAVAPVAPASNQIALAAGAGIGAGTALGVGVAAASGAFDGDKQEDAFAVPKSAEPRPDVASASTGFDDAFNVPATSGQAPAQASDDFDDNFGDDFGASATPAASGAAAPATATAFDDAFGDDFDGSKPVAATTSSAKETVSSDAPADGFGSAFAPGAAVKTPDGAAVEPEHAPQSDEEDPGVGYGKPRAPADSDEDDSSDEEEGPEDVGGYKQAGPGGGAKDTVANATPMTDTTASERFPDISDVQDDEEGPFGGSGEVPTSSVDTDNIVGSVANAEPSVPGGFGAFGEAAEDPTAAITTSAPVDASAIGAADTSSAASIAPVSRQETGAADKDDGLLGVGAFAGAGVLGAGLGAAALAGSGSNEAPPLSPGAEDDDVPLGQILSKRAAATEPSSVTDAAASQPSLSPSSSIKTRRAPPPAPVRQSSTLSAAPTVLAAAPTGAAPAVPVSNAASTSTTTPTPVPATGASSNPFGTDDFAPAAPTSSTAAAKSAPVSGASSGTNKNTASSSSNFDDFDSAFEDLGQAEVAPTSAAGVVGTSGATAGFDDAFDNDFDFVPSFDNNATGSTTSKAVAQAGSSDPFFASSGPSSSQAAASNAGFEDFDSAFDPASGSVSKPAEGGAAGSGSQANSGSGFSFEDAFAPTSSNAAALPAPAVTGGNATVPPATYAPPPGPPPPALPERKATAPSSEAVNALPDDAAPVKQLCGMGFERPKVIEALEKSNYRTEKALERLLAQA